MNTISLNDTFKFMGIFDLAYIIAMIIYILILSHFSSIYIVGINKIQQEKMQEIKDNKNIE